MRCDAIIRHDLERNRTGAGSRNRQRGSGRFKAIVWTAILGFFVYACIKVVPVLIDQYEFQDIMITTARFASVKRQTAEDIRTELMKEAEKAQIPIRREDLRVTAANGNVKIDANYSVTVDLQVYQWTLNFHPSATNNSI